MSVEGQPERRVFSLVEKRQEQIKGEQPLKAEEMLDELSADIKAGKVNPEAVMVFVLDKIEGGRLRPELRRANVSYAECLGYLELAQKIVLDDWRDS